MHRYLTAARRLRRLVDGTHRVLSLVYVALCDAIAVVCLTIMLTVLGIVVLTGAGLIAAAWHDSGVRLDAAGVVVIGIIAGLAALVVRDQLNRREARHYDMQRPWLTTVEQAQADERLRRQVASYAAQKRRTHAVTTGEHAAIGGAS